MIVTAVCWRCRYPSIPGLITAVCILVYMIVYDGSCDGSCSHYAIRMFSSHLLTNTLTHDWSGLCMKCRIVYIQQYNILLTLFLKLEQHFALCRRRLSKKGLPLHCHCQVSRIYLLICSLRLASTWLKCSWMASLASTLSPAVPTAATTTAAIAAPSPRMPCLPRPWLWRLRHAAVSPPTELPSIDQSWGWVLALVGAQWAASWSPARSAHPHPGLVLTTGGQQQHSGHVTPRHSDVTCHVPPRDCSILPRDRVCKGNIETLPVFAGFIDWRYHTSTAHCKIE